MPDPETFSLHMRSLREQAGWTQKEMAGHLAHVVGVNQGTVSRMERGVWIPDAGQLALILTGVGATERQAERARNLAAHERVRDGVSLDADLLPCGDPKAA